MPEVWAALGTHRDNFRDDLVRWGRRRGWPEEIAQNVASDPEIAWAVPSTGDLEADRVTQLALNTRMETEDRGWQSFALPVLTAHRDPKGRVRSFNRRHSELLPAPPSKTAYAPTHLTLYRGVRVIGQIPLAVEALVRGEPVYLVEGEPDFAVASALARLDGRGYALGAPAHLWLPNVARELRRAVLEDGREMTGHIVIVPHVGDFMNVGYNSALDAANELQRAAQIRLATVSETKGDLADVLEARGKTQDLRDVLARAEVIHEGPIALTTRRRQLGRLVPGLLRKQGHHVVRGVTGIGKTRILLEELLELAAQIVEARRDYRRDGVIPLDPFLKYAVDKPKVLLQYTVPTRGLRTELYEWIKKLAREKRVYNFAAVSIREKKSRADGYTDPHFCRFPRETAAAAKTVAGGALDVCQGCNMFDARAPAMSGCGFWTQLRQAAGEVIIEITTHAAARESTYLDEDGNQVTNPADKKNQPDIRVIDESPVDTWYESIQVDMTQLATALQCGDLHTDDATWRKLSDFVAHGASSTAFNHTFSATDFSAGDGQTTGKKYMKDAAADPANRIQHLEASPDWRFWRRFEQAGQHSWAGVYAHKKHLTVIDREVQTNSGWSTVYADATVTRDIAEALLPGCSWHELDMPLPASVKVIRTTWTAGKSNIMRRDNKQIRRKWLASHVTYDGPGVLHITHKDLFDELRDRVQGHVTYYGAADATGSNRFEDCTRVVADAWYVPNAAVDGLAGKFAATDAQGRPAAYWRDAARDHLVNRRISQALGRIRPFDGRKAELVILSPDKDQRIPGLEADAICNGDTLAWTHDQQPHGNVLGETIRHLVDRDGLFIPALHLGNHSDPDGVASGHAKVANCRSIEASCVDWVSAPFAGAALDPDQVQQQLKDHYAKDWTELALDTGLMCYLVPTSNGGHPLPVLAGGPTSPAALLPHMKELGLTWFRWRGKRVVVEVDPRLEDATAAAVASLGEGEALTTEAIAAAGDVSARTVRRWIKDAGVAVADWLEVHTPTLPAGSNKCHDLQDQPSQTLAADFRTPGEGVLATLSRLSTPPEDWDPE